MRIDLIVGARPNYMKAAPVYSSLEKRGKYDLRLVHTGQHYDEKMSRIFFDELHLPRPDIYLGVGSGLHGEQTAKVMESYEKTIIDSPPDLTVVVGDVNSTMACALVAVKLHVKVAHIEAGLRSGDWSMPEEINRVVTDRIAHFLFTTCRDADENLLNEGVSKDKIFFVGNTMIDTLLSHLDKADSLPVLSDLSLNPGDYALVTLHRPSNVDEKSTYEGIFEAFRIIQKRLPVVFPIHPRSRKMLVQFGLEKMIREMSQLILTEPLGYLEFLKLQKEARFVMTDSGGIQEETTVLNVPCLTLRKNTERPITITEGTNQLVGMNPDKIVEKALKLLDGEMPSGKIPEFWDGRASERIADILEKVL